MTYGNAHFRRWLHLCGAVLAAFYFSLSASAQTVYKKVTDPYGAVSEGRLRVVSIVKNPSPATTYKVTLSYMGKIKLRDNGQAIGAGGITFYEGVGSFFSVGDAGIYGGTHTVDRNLDLQGDGRLRGSIRVNVGGEDAQTYYYADAIYEFSFNLAGGTNGSIYQVYQGSNYIEQVRVAPDDVYLYKYTSSDPTPVYVFRQSAVKGMADGFWQIRPGAYESTAAGTSTGSSGSGSSTPVDVPAGNGGAGTITNGGGGAGSGPDGNEWSHETNNTNLTQDVFKQGVDGIIKAIKANGGGGGGGTDVSGIESRLDSLVSENARKKGLEDAANADSGPGGVVNSSNASTKGSGHATSAKTQADGAAASLKTAAETALSSFTPSAPSSVTAPSSSESDSIQIQILPGNVVSIPKNPFSASGPFGGVMGDLAGFVKKLIAWGIVAAFVIWAHKRLQEMIEAPFNVAPFGTAISDTVNSVKIAGFGGGFGMIARVAAGAVILPILLTLPVAGVAALTAGLPWGEVKTVFSAGVGSLPSSGMLGKAFWLSDQVIPWVTLLTAPVWYFTVQYVLFPSKLFWMIFMKYVSL